ncbi:hypothetical protein BJY01DRAFT_220075 [Aspergillus pseudoustus]|uniref:RNase H type-1 domain-containing protein n=1 Tax=Aspergillus pseudoustus TaxID=1810923 RepID=A0ABR4JE05_9EURO
MPDVDFDNTLAMWKDASMFPDLELSGCAVTYKKQPTSSDWVQRTFSLPSKCSSKSGELFPIMGAVIIAADIVQKRCHDSKTPRRIIIFSDCTQALQAIRANKRNPRCAKMAASCGILLVKLAEKSLEINRSGILLELRCVPGHSGNPGNRRAHVLARRAAKANKSTFVRRPDNCVSVKVDKMRMHEISREYQRR